MDQQGQAIAMWVCFNYVCIYPYNYLFFLIGTVDVLKYNLLKSLNKIACLNMKWYYILWIVGLYIVEMLCDFNFYLTVAKLNHV